MRARLHGPIVLAGCLMVLSTQDVLTPSGNLAEITYRSATRYAIGVLMVLYGLFRLFFRSPEPGV
jgi:hypothetical protein